jgi:chromosome partitioning protein
VNQKGGCGKTTTAINLSACLALEHRKVLLIDLDPQAHATLGLNVQPEGIEKGMYEVLSGHANLDDVLMSLSPNLWLAPSNVTLSAIEQILAGTQDRERQLLNKMVDLKTSFDYVIIDCPPSVGLLTFNALISSDRVIVPVETSFFSLQGLSKLAETVQIIGERVGHDIDVRVLPTKFDRRTSYSKEVLGKIYERFKELSFNTVINLNEKLREATSLGLPITEYAPDSTGFKDYLNLAREVLALEKEQEIPAAISEIPVGPQIVCGVLFSVRAPHAREVKLAGDFNQWVPDRNVLTVRDDQGLWKKFVLLPRGSYHYKFLIDDEWKEDPHNPVVSSTENGLTTSLITVEEVSLPLLKAVIPAGTIPGSEK